jgi:hypothetical protein
MTGSEHDSYLVDPGSVQYVINKALGLTPKYVYEGVDILAGLLDKALGNPPASPGAP